MVCVLQRGLKIQFPVSGTDPNPGPEMVGIGVQAIPGADQTFRVDGWTRTVERLSEVAQQKG